MKWGKGLFPEGEGPQEKPEAAAEDHDGEKGREQIGTVPDENNANHVAKEMESRGDKEENSGRKTPDRLQPTRSLVKKKWTLSVTKRRESSLPREVHLTENKDQSDSGDDHANGASRRSGSSLPCKDQPSTFPSDAVATEATAGIPKTAKGRKEEKDLDVSKLQNNLPKPDDARRTSPTASPARVAERSPLEKREAEGNRQNESVLTGHGGGSPSDQKACLVCVRVRPESLQEISAGGSLCVDTRHASVGTVTVSGLKDRQYSFHFDYVFDQDATQEAVYRSTCECLLEKLMAGYSATVMAYGQTGAGKTYTMLGELGECDFHRALTDPTTRGVVPRLLEALFQRILLETKNCNEIEGGATQQNTEECVEQKENGKPGVTFSIRASLVEVYNDNVRDLLAPTRDTLCIRDSSCTSSNRINSGAVLTEATEVPVATAEEAFALIYTGFANRAHGTTLLNDKSSRSHAIFQLIVRRNSLTACRVTCSRLCLVDLAGSERVSKADSSGVRLREAQSINKSLLALGNVISALPQSQKKGQKVHVPYRDSKLTRLLQHSFGGHTFTVLLLCCSPHTFNVKETLSTFRFGDRAANLKNEPLSVEAVDPELLLHRLQEAQTELRISQAQIRAYVVQTARQVDALRMLHAYVPQDVTLSDDDQALLKLALQEVPVLSQQQRLQLHSPAPPGAAILPGTASTNRPLKMTAAQPSIAAPGAQKKGLSSPKAVDYTQAQKRLPQDKGRADRTGDNASTRPRTAPHHPTQRPPTSMSQRGSPTARRPVDHRKLQAAQGGHPDVGKRVVPAARERDLEKLLCTRTGGDNREVCGATDAGAAQKPAVQNNAALNAPGEKEDISIAAEKMPATALEGKEKDDENEPQVVRSASKCSAQGDSPAGGGTEKENNVSSISRDKTPSRLSKFFSLSRGKSVNTKDTGLRAQHDVSSKDKAK